MAIAEVDGRVALAEKPFTSLNASELADDKPALESDPVQLDRVLAAAKRMVAAINGEGPKCDPVTVCKRADGTYEVLDGHDILQAAKLAGWTKLPNTVVETLMNYDVIGDIHGQADKLVVQVMNA